MKKLDGITLNPYEPESLLTVKAANELGVPVSFIKDIKILKKSVDARKKRDIKLVYSLAVGTQGEHRTADSDAYRPLGGSVPEGNVVVAGAGPAGLFCALILARAGAKVILLERGSDAMRRKVDIERFQSGGGLDPESNVQFGLGGAGTFSDGKLTTGKNDSRLGFIISEFVRLGAPEDIEYLAKPHIGTDRLLVVVGNLREELERLGVKVRFNTKLDSFQLKHGGLHSVTARTGVTSYAIDTNHLVLATGHSARDTYEMLHAAGVEMKQKSFSVGVRIEHLQSDITAAQYGEFAGAPSLPVPDYKLACHLGSGRSAYSFCVCPGGSVIAAASEDGGVVTNGMSNYARDGVNTCGGLLVGVNPSDYGSSHPLGGIYFQRKLERAAFALGGGGYIAPCQTVGDFLLNKASKEYEKVRPTYLPGVRMCNISDCLPEYITETLRDAIPAFGRKLSGFDAPQALLTAVETRSSAPVTIVRDADRQSSIPGIYPCGEGAGQAGGIMSAAADGIKVAEAILHDA